MKRQRGLLNGVAGLLCIGLALVIVAREGLPQRAETLRGLTNAPNYVAPMVGYLAPEITLPTTDGRIVSLADSDSPLTLVYFWATTCPPCRHDMPAMNALADNESLRILAVNVGESAEATRDWADALGLEYAVLPDPSATTARRYKIRGLPTGFLTNAGGRILRVYFGSVGVERLRRDMARYAPNA